MADPLSITASIVGIVTLGFQIVRGLYQIADGIGSAGEEVRLYAEEINQFSELLNHIRVHIFTTCDIPFDSRSLVKDVICICDKILQPFHRLQNTLDSFFTRFKQSPKKLKQFGFRVKWVFCDKKKLMFYIDALRNQHRILNTALDLASLQTMKDRTPSTIYIMRMSLENSVSAITTSLCSSPGGRISQITRTSEQPFDDYLGLTGQSALISLQDASERSSNPDDTEVVSPTEAGLDPQRSNDIADSPIASESQQDQLTTHEMQILENQIEQDLDPDSGMTAAEVWEDTRSILRKAKRLAAEALSSSETQVTASWGTSARFAHKDYTVGWVCTRPIEYAVAEGMLDEQHPALPQVGDDTNTYTLGEMQKHNVVLLCIPAGAMETGIASTAVSGMLRSFPYIRIRLLVGIAGGIPDLQTDMRLGDVVVGSPASSSGGVMLLKGSGESISETRTLETPPRELGNALATLQARHIRRENDIKRHVEEMLEANPAMRLPFSVPDPEGDLLFEAHYEHPNKSVSSCHECESSRVIPRLKHRGRPAVFYGPIGWTTSVINSSPDRDAISYGRGIYCIEMETMGLINFFPCLVIRGIWNYSDSHKNKAWQGYAAATAAGYAKELLETVQTTVI